MKAFKNSNRKKIPQTETMSVWGILFIYFIKFGEMFYYQLLTTSYKLKIT